MPNDPVMLWLGLAVVLFAIVYGFRRAPYVSRLWAAIPDDLKPFAPVALAVTFEAGEAIASGRSLRQALAIAASAALAAHLAHHGLRAAPGPYGSRPKVTFDIGDRTVRLPPPARLPSSDPPRAA